MPIDFDSYGLDDELKAKIKSDYESDVSGLLAKNTDLIGREKTAKAAFEEAQLKAAEDAENVKVALAEKEGNIEGYKLAIAERDESLATVRREFQERDNSRIMLEGEVSFSSNVVDDPAAQHYMKGLFRDNTEVVEGVLRPKDVSITMDQLKANLVSDKANLAYIKANVGSGAGAAGSNSGGAASIGTADFSSKNKQERTNAAIAANPKLANLPLR